MATLKTNPGSSTKLQRQRLVILGRRAGYDLAEIRKMVGGSVSKLSALKASEWIVHFGGGKLPNPPGEKPGPYDGRKPTPGVTRMITDDQINQINRLLCEYFDADARRATEWLKSNFKVHLLRDLATAKRAGQVIHVLKVMLSRRAGSAHQGRVGMAHQVVSGQSSVVSADHASELTTEN